MVVNGKRVGPGRTERVFVPLFFSRKPFGNPNRTAPVRSEKAPRKAGLFHMRYRLVDFRGVDRGGRDAGRLPEEDVLVRRAADHEVALRVERQMRVRAARGVGRVDRRAVHRERPAAVVRRVGLVAVQIAALARKVRACRHVLHGELAADGGDPEDIRIRNVGERRSRLRPDAVCCGYPERCSPGNDSYNRREGRNEPIGSDRNRDRNDPSGRRQHAVGSRSGAARALSGQ